MTVEQPPFIPTGDVDRTLIDDLLAIPPAERVRVMAASSRKALPFMKRLRAEMRARYRLPADPGG